MLSFAAVHTRVYSNKKTSKNTLTKHRAFAFNDVKGQPPLHSPCEFQPVTLHATANYYALGGFARSVQEAGSGFAGACMPRLVVVDVAGTSSQIAAPSSQNACWNVAAVGVGGVGVAATAKC